MNVGLEFVLPFLFIIGLAAIIGAVVYVVLRLRAGGAFPHLPGVPSARLPLPGLLDKSAGSDERLGRTGERGSQPGLREEV